MADPAITRDIERYYTDKLRAHGATPQGVDWNGADSQTIRFAQLAKIAESDPDGSLTDLGCGYGAFLPYLRHHGFRGIFTGIDLSSDMITAAQAHCAGIANASFVSGAAPPAATDYVTASGVLNVKLRHSDEDWRAHALETLDMLDHFSVRGFAFNCLTGYSDKDKMRPDLYYMDPLFAFDHCKKRYARNVALLHDYGLFEFTILVRK